MVLAVLYCGTGSHCTVAMVLHCGPGCTVVLGPYAVVLVVTVLWYLSLHSGTGCPCSLLLAITERLYCSQNCSTGCHCTVAMVTIPQYWSLQYHVVLAVTVLWNWSLYCGTGCHCTVVLVPKCGTGPRTDYQLSLCCCAAHPLHCTMAFLTLLQVLLPKMWHWLSQSRGAVCCSTRR